MVRIKSKWHNQTRAKTPEELGGAAGFIGWRLATHHVEEIEAAGFRLTSPEQRFALLREWLVFLVQSADRLAFQTVSDEDRSRFISALARHMAGTLEDNQHELLGPGQHAKDFIDLLNAEIPDYAELSFGKDGPGYRFLRYLGDKVLAIVGQEDANRWVIDQVMEIEAPAAIASLRKGLDNLFAGRNPEQGPGGGASAG